MTNRRLVAYVLLLAALVILPGAYPQCNVESVSIEDSTAGVLVRVYGPRKDARIGESFAAGDLNGDGLDDLVVGDRLMKAGAENAGGVHVLFAPSQALPCPPETPCATGWPAQLELGSPAQLLAQGVRSVRIVGTDKDDLFGHAVAIGPVTCATCSDLVVAALWADDPLPNAGGVYLFTAAKLIRAASAGVELDAERDADVYIGGGGTSDMLGVQIAIGDVGSDGTKELVLTAPLGNERDDKRMIGRAYLVTAGPGLLAAGGEQRRFDLRRADDPNTPRIEGYRTLLTGFDTGVGGDRREFVRNNQGIAFADVDGDARNDLVLGNPFWDRYEGSVHILYGSSFIPMDGKAPLRAVGAQVNLGVASASAETSDFLIRNASGADAQLGAAVAVADFLGDPLPDLVLGAPGARNDTANARERTGVLYTLSAIEQGIRRRPASSPIISLRQSPQRAAADTPDATAIIVGRRADDWLGHALALLPGPQGRSHVVVGMPTFERVDTRRRTGAIAFFTAGQDGLLGHSASVCETTAGTLRIVAGAAEDDFFGLNVVSTYTAVAGSPAQVESGVWVGAWGAGLPGRRGTGAIYLLRNPFSALAPGNPSTYSQRLFDLARRWYGDAHEPARLRTGAADSDELLRLIAERRQQP